MRGALLLFALLGTGCSDGAEDIAAVEETVIAGSDAGIEAKADLVARFDVPACNEAELQSTERLSDPAEAGGARAYLADQACMSALREALGEEGFAASENGSIYTLVNASGWTETVELSALDSANTGTIVWETRAP